MVPRKRASGDRTDQLPDTRRLYRKGCRKHGPANPHTLADANCISSILAGPRCALFVYFYDGGRFSTQAQLVWFT